MEFSQAIRSLDRQGDTEACCHTQNTHTCTEKHRDREASKHAGHTHIRTHTLTHMLYTTRSKNMPTAFGPEVIQKVLQITRVLQFALSLPSLHGVANETLHKLLSMLPPSLTCTHLQAKAGPSISNFFLLCPDQSHVTRLRASQAFCFQPQRSDLNNERCYKKMKWGFSAG